MEKTEASMGPLRRGDTLSEVMAAAVVNVKVEGGRDLFCFCVLSWVVCKGDGTTTITCKVEMCYTRTGNMYDA